MLPLIYIVADAAQPLLGILDGSEVHAGGKGTPPDIVHTAFHMSLLPSCTCIAETEMETVESTHAEQCLRGLFPVRLQNDSHFHVVIHHRMRHTMYVMEEITMRLHKGQIVLVAEEVSPSSLAMTQGEYSHRKCHGLAAYAQLDLPPVKLAFLARLVVLLDKDILGLMRLFRLALLDVLADTGVADVETFLYQSAVDVLFS